MANAENGLRSIVHPVITSGATPPSWLGLAAALADVAFELDLQGRFAAFGAAAVFGREAESLLGTPANAFFNLRDGVLESVIADLGFQSGTWRGKVAIRDASGAAGMFRLALTAWPLQGEPTCIAGLLTDLVAPLIDISAQDDADAEDAVSQVTRLLCPSTGLWSLSSFVEQTARRFDRLDVEDRPGTLLCLGFARASAALRTSVALRLTEELREIIRPTDLLGRIAPAVIAIWYDGMDHLTGAERAARFCKYIPSMLPDHVLISAGVATRWPGSADDPQTMIERARLALRDAEAATDRDAVGSWRVWQKTSGD
jgi:hypothetical protein